MKDKIHPKYVDAKIECACGNVIETRSTQGSYKIDICSACHPFFTGKQKLVDTAGRVERFRRKYGLEQAPEDSASEQESIQEPADTGEPQQEAPQADESIQEEKEKDTSEKKTDEQ